MIKKYLFSSLAALALGFVVSCDNTTDDPPNQNKTTTGGNTITGPRILAKINNGTKDLEEYITNGGALSQAFTRDAGSNNTLTSTVIYSGDKIDQIKIQDNVNPHVIDNTYKLTYTSGKLSSFTMDQTILGVVNHSDFTVYYDANGQLYRVVEKKKLASTSYTHYIETKYTFSATNIVKTDYTTMLMSGGNPDPSTSSTMSYFYDNYDTKINPYTTLPKEYFIVSLTTTTQANSYMLSTNNVGKVTIQNPSGPSISYPKMYTYDSQNYPVTDQGGLKYIYKPL